MKNIIQRALPLTEKYFLIDKKYIPLTEGCGTCCDNCGQLIANMATVRRESGELFTIGFDCLETILINNQLLSSGDIAEYERVKAQLPKIIRAAKKLKEAMDINKSLNITGIIIERPMFKESKYYTIYWLRNNQTESRDNDLMSINKCDFELVVETLRNIFPKLTIITK